MSSQLVCAHIEQVKEFLTETVSKLSSYLDNYCMEALLAEQGCKNKAYYKELLKSVRRLNVFCDEALDAVGILARSEAINESSAERTLYGIYHQCILEFYSPKNDAWFENSRAAYTGHPTIKFHDSPPESLGILIQELEDPFQEIREELAYYETNYRQRMS